MPGKPLRFGAEFRAGETAANARTYPSRNSKGPDVSIRSAHPAEAVTSAALACRAPTPAIHPEEDCPKLLPRMGSHRAGSLCLSAAVPGDEGGEVGGGHANGVQDANVREFAACAEVVDRRGADAEAASDLSDTEQIPLDPSWTRRFVFPRGGMGDSWSRLWYRPE